MFDADLRQELESVLSSACSDNVVLSAFHSVSGGCINYAYKVESNVGDFFVKLNDHNKYPQMFEREADGIRLLSEANTIELPEVVALGNDGNRAYLILNYIESSPRSSNFWENFGRSLAKVHQRSADSFGLEYDNYIGSLKQFNSPAKDWIDFFIHERIEKQVQLAIDSGLLNDSQTLQFEQLYKKLDSIFPEEPPALLHGDLWSGNFMVGGNGEAVIYDPAVYYGHREMELAFTTLFGGFDQKFYDTYEEIYPLAPGFIKRKDIYNLYPLLVHLNLFGTGYRSSVESILNRFVS